MVMKSLISTSVLLLQVVALSAYAATPKTVSVALSTEPPTLNSTKVIDTTSGFIVGHIMEGLTRYGKTGEPVPGVAETWTVTDTGATFTLRKTAKWSDGKPVTAKDFVFAWQRVVDPANASGYAFIMYPLRIRTSGSTSSKTRKSTRRP